MLSPLRDIEEAPPSPGALLTSHHLPAPSQHPLSEDPKIFRAEPLTLRIPVSFISPSNILYIYLLIYFIIFLSQLQMKEFLSVWLTTKFPSALKRRRHIVGYQ